MVSGGSEICFLIMSLSFMYSLKLKIFGKKRRKNWLPHFMILQCSRLPHVQILSVIIFKLKRATHKFWLVGSIWSAAIRVSGIKWSPRVKFLILEKPQFKNIYAGKIYVFSNQLPRYRSFNKLSSARQVVTLVF